MTELPFTIEQFLKVFEKYNGSVWPVHIIAYGMGFWAVFLTVSSKTDSSKFINRILALFWIWIGIAYHILNFTAINSAAYIFGALFIIQGIGFLMLNRTATPFRFEFRKDSYGLVGLLMIFYSMILYPLAGYFLGHTYPQAPVFGVAPCPSVIFTFGLLLWTKGRIPLFLLIIPGLWSLVGFSAAWQLNMCEDFGLVIAGFLGTVMILYRNHKLKTVNVKTSSLHEA